MRASWDAVKITFLDSYLVVVRVLNFDIKCKNELFFFSFQFALFASSYRNDGNKR